MGDRISEFLGKWNTPAGWMVLFGAIVWGIQLNYAVIGLVDTLAEERQARLQLAAEVNQISLNQAKTGVILDQLLDRLERVDNHIEVHDADAERWKQQIIENKTKLEEIQINRQRWRNNGAYR